MLKSINQKLQFLNIERNVLILINFTEVGNRIRDCREEIKYSQEQLALELEYASRQTIGKWENGDITANIDDFIKLCNIFNCDMGYLLGEFDTKRHIVADVQEVTGLSEAAIETLKTCNTEILPMGDDITDNLFVLETVNFLLSCDVGRKTLRLIGEYLFENYKIQYVESDILEFDKTLEKQEKTEIEKKIEELQEEKRKYEFDSYEEIIQKVQDGIYTEQDSEMAKQLDEEIQKLLKEQNNTFYTERSAKHNEKIVTVQSELLSTKDEPVSMPVAMEDLKAGLIIRLNQEIKSAYDFIREDKDELERISKRARQIYEERQSNVEN